MLRRWREAGYSARNTYLGWSRTLIALVLRHVGPLPKTTPPRTSENPHAVLASPFSFLKARTSLEPWVGGRLYVCSITGVEQTVRSWWIHDRERVYEPTGYIQPMYASPKHGADTFRPQVSRAERLPRT